MKENGLSVPDTDESLAKAMSKAVTEGNYEEIDRLMAVELPEPEDKDEEEDNKSEEESVTDEEETPDTQDTPTEGDNTPEKGEKDEAAGDVPAASKPDKSQVSAPKKDDDLPESVKAELHRLRSDVGRVPYMQRRLQELERELRAATLSRDVDKSTAAPSGEVQIPENLSKRIEALREIDPDLADTLAEMAKTLKSETVNTSSKLIENLTKADQERADEEYLQTQYQQLVTEVPYAPQVFQSPQWKQWKETLSPGRRALAESIHADEVKMAIGAFIYEMQARHGGTQQQPAAASPPEGDTPDESATKVQEERNRKLQGTTDGKSVAAKRGAPVLDEEAQFKQFYAQIQKDNHLVKE